MGLGRIWPMTATRFWFRHTKLLGVKKNTVGLPKKPKLQIDKPPPPHPYRSTHTVSTRSLSFSLCLSCPLCPIGTPTLVQSHRFLYPQSTALSSNSRTIIPFPPATSSRLRGPSQRQNL